MVRSIRFFAGLAFITSAVLFSIGASPTAFADDDKKPDKKDEKKKLEMPKLPEGSNPKWDFESVEEKFTIVKGSVNDIGEIYFLLELKEDMASIPKYQVVFIDKDGVKYYKTTTSTDPSNGVKGDRVRMKLFAGAPTDYKDRWIQAIKVRIVAD